MSGLPLVRRFLADYARNPVNVLMLVLVPVVFVVVAAGRLSEVAEVLGAPGGPTGFVASAGWAAGFLAGIAMYFQVRSAREADRRLVLAGMHPWRFVAARMVTGFCLAVLAAAAALVALVARTNVAAPGRAVTGAVLFALIYLAIGALAGATVRNPVNGTVLVLLIWIIDVFFGPAMGMKDREATRWLPTHYVTLWMIDLPSGHSGRLGDLGWALVWLLGALVAGAVVVAVTSRVARRSRRLARAGSIPAQLAVTLRMGLRGALRNLTFWVLLVAVPAIYILGSVPITPDGSEPMSVVEGGREVLRMYWLPDVHPATMAPIGVGSLAALAGLFLVLDTRTGDRRLTLAGTPVGVVLAARIFLVVLASVVAAAAAIGVTALVFDARQWVWYALANVLVAVTYGLIGVVLGPLFGRVAGVFIAFLVPFLDLGIGQSPMLRSGVPEWAEFLPGYGAYRVLLDGGLTASFDESGALLLASGWLAGLIVLATLVFRHGLSHVPVQAGAEAVRRNG
ncbi:ABC transporter permease [Flindersiella endophytica]